MLTKKGIKNDIATFFLKILLFFVIILIDYLNE